jgi:hypothetical protein
MLHSSAGGASNMPTSIPSVRANYKKENYETPMKRNTSKRDSIINTMLLEDIYFLVLDFISIYTLCNLSFLFSYHDAIESCHPNFAS